MKEKEFIAACNHVIDVILTCQNGNQFYACIDWVNYQYERLKKYSIKKGYKKYNLISNITDAKYKKLKEIQRKIFNAYCNNFVEICKYHHAHPEDRNNLAKNLFQTEQSECTIKAAVDDMTPAQFRRFILNILGL